MTVVPRKREVTDPDQRRSEGWGCVGGVVVEIFVKKMN